MSDFEQLTEAVLKIADETHPGWQERNEKAAKELEEQQKMKCPQCGGKLWTTYYQTRKKRGVCSSKCKAARDARTSYANETPEQRSRRKAKQKKFVKGLKLRALRVIGSEKCCKCGCSDIRVLHINHLRGKWHEADFIPARSRYLKIINGSRPVDDLNVLCANCNILYEYERGNISP